MDRDSDIKPHVVIFPLPIQGPVNCMLKVAELILVISKATISITFVNTDFIQHKLELNSQASARLARFGSCFRFVTVPDGLGPFENPRGDPELVDITNYLGEQARGGLLRELPEGPVTCVIADGFFWFMTEIAKDIGVPLVYFETLSPYALWTYLCLPRMIRARDLPFQGEDLDVLIKSVPGMETYLRRRDLPDFCRDYDPNNNALLKLILKEMQQYPRAQGHILNTFDDLEGELLSHMRPFSPNMYTLGPLHLNLTRRLEEDSSRDTNLSISLSNNLLQEDKTCLTWLNSQPSKSVLFVSIGSMVSMTKEQLVEFWHGLVNSKTRFLWVRRPNSIIDLDDEDQLEISKDVLEGTKERGCIVSWAPQEEVLTHDAIGGFLTHSGWNSTLESIVEGVPMICWPHCVDQLVNSRLVSEVWKIGLDMKDTCSRDVIETMINDLMGTGTRKEEFLRNADYLAKSAAQAVDEGGSSYDNLIRLIEDIKFMRLPVLSNAS